MTRDILKLNRGGYYIGDYRFDEGVRIRDDFISPCLCSNTTGRGISTMILLIEVDDENQERNE